MARLRRTILWFLPALILIALWVPGVNQGGWRVDTGLYAAISRWAYESGSWWTLRTGDQDYFNKPPLAFWVHGAFLWWLGPSLWVARLPSLLAAIGATLGLMDAVRTLAGRRLAIVSGCVLATTIEFFRFGHAISLDLCVTMFLMVAVALCARGARSGRASPFLIAGVAVGLSLMVKPLLGLFALSLLGAWMVWDRKARLAVWLVPAAVVAGLVALPWHLSMVQTYGEAFTGVYFGSQVMERAAGGEAFKSEPWWFYFRKILDNYWPWLITLVLCGWSLARGGWSRLRDGQRSALRLAVVWCAGWLVALTLFGGKSSRYMLVVQPLLAVPSAVWLVRLAPAGARRASRVVGRWAPVVVIAGALLVAIVGVPVRDSEREEWSSFRRFREANPDTTLWTDDRSATRWLSSKVYLLTGQWPRTMREGAEPEPGDFIMFRRDAMPDGNWVEVWSEEGLVVVRAAVTKARGHAGTE